MIRTQRALTLVIVAAHWLFAVSHLFAASRVLPSPNNGVSGTGVLLITVGHVAVAIALWLLSEKTSSAISLVFFLAAISADLYEHFLHVSLNDVFLITASNWSARFDSSVVVLLALEVMGCFLGIMSLSRWRPAVEAQTAHQ